MKFPNRLKPIFLISSPRSGTTWLSKMLNVHPQIYCTENRLFGDYADLIQDDNAAHPRLRVTLDKYVHSLSLHSNTEGLSVSREEFRAGMLDTLIQSMLEFQRKLSGKKVCVDKITPYVGTSYVVRDQLDKFFPDSTVIFLVRDGRDVCTSGVFHWLKKRPSDRDYTDFEKQRREIILEGSKNDLPRFFQDAEIREWAATWSEPLELIPYFQKNRPVLVVKFEDMLINSDSILNKIFSFIGVKNGEKYIKECVQAGSFRLMTGGREKGADAPGEHVRKGIAGDWKNYFTQKDIDLFESLAGEFLKKYGYKE